MNVLLSGRLPGLLAVLTLLVTSCSLFSEEGRTVIEGQVVDSHTEQAVGPAEVRLHASSGSSSAYSPVDEWRATDAQGHFSFSFDADGDQRYILMASSPRGASAYATSPTIKGGRKNKGVRVPVQAPAWVRLHLRDLPPRSDAANISVGGALDKSFTIAPPLDTVLVQLSWPYTANTIVWQLRGGRTNDNDEHRIPFTVAGMDTVTVDITY